MSKKQQTLLITPPLLSKEHPNEMETFTGFECSKCYGNGWIIALGDDVMVGPNSRDVQTKSFQAK